MVLLSIVVFSLARRYCHGKLHRGCSEIFVCVHVWKGVLLDVLLPFGEGSCHRVLLWCSKMCCYGVLCTHFTVAYLGFATQNLGYIDNLVLQPIYQLIPCEACLLMY